MMTLVGAGGSRLTAAKLVVALVGIAVFGTGIRMEEPTWRWIGIALVAVAWLLRLAGRRDRVPRQFPEDTR